MSNYNDQNIHSFQSSPAARVSFTLNGKQPVQCSFIEDAQLFYADHEDADEDRYGEPFPVADSIEQASGIEKLQADYELTTSEYIALFQEARNSVTGQGASDTQVADLNTITDIIAKSNTAKAYLDHAEKFGVELTFDGSVKTALYDRDEALIRINPTLATEHQVLTTLQELRRHWQHRQGALLNPLSFQPENAILINRMQHADLISSTVRCAWELKLAGETQIWKTVFNSSYADIARSYVSEAHKDFRTIASGFATTAAFEAWFLSERCRHVDRELIRQMLVDHAGYVFNVEADQSSLQPTLISALGEVPLGKNYLAKYASTILSDPIFSEVRDRSNANFLWFIKFERNFRETEHDLQNDVTSAASAHSTSSQGHSDAEKIVVLYDTENQPDQQRNVACGGSSKGANIVHFSTSVNNADL